MRVLARHAPGRRRHARLVLGDRQDPDAAGPGARAPASTSLVDVVAYDDRQADAAARARATGSGRRSSSPAPPSTSTSAGDGLRDRGVRRLPRPGRRGPADRRARARHLRDRQGRARAGLARPPPCRRRSCAPARSTGRGAASRASGRSSSACSTGATCACSPTTGESRFHTTSTAVLAELVRLAAQRPGDRVLNAADPQALTVAEIAARRRRRDGRDLAPRPPSRASRSTASGCTPWAVPRPLVLDMRRAADELGYVAPGGYADTVGACVAWLVEDASAARLARGVPRLRPDGGDGRLLRVRRRGRVPRPHVVRADAGPSAMMNAMTTDLAADNPFATPSTLPVRPAGPHADPRGALPTRPARRHGGAARRDRGDRVRPRPRRPSRTRSRRSSARAACCTAPPSRSSTSPARTPRPASTRSRRRSRPLLAAHHDAIYLDPRLFARVAALQADVDSGALELEPDTAWLLRPHAHRSSSARASGSTRRRRTACACSTARSDSLETAFGRDLLAATNAAGRPGHRRERARRAGRGRPRRPPRKAARDRGHEQGWLLELELPDAAGAAGTSLTRPGLRERVFRASIGRGAAGDEHDTRATLLGLARKRAERAQLLGYAHHAEYVAADATAKTAEAVADILERLAPAAVANARVEARRPRRGARARPPRREARAVGLGVLRRAGQEGAALARRRPCCGPTSSSSACSPTGCSAPRTTLYGLTFAERHDLVGYHPDVRVFEVFDEDGTGLGLFLGDFWTRESQARRRLDEQPRRPVDAARRAARRRQQPQHPEAAARASRRC